MARINVFLGDGLLEAVDAEAADAEVSRSGLIQAALADYLARRRTERAEVEARRQMEEASRGMDKLATKLGDWDPVTIIREFRDSRMLIARESRGRYRKSRRGRRA